MKKIFFPLVFYMTFCGVIINAQNGSNISYGPLFTSSNFTKNINTNLDVGKIQATASVSNGISSYSIPIELPPGTNGLIPNIALNYQSNSGDGIAGMGWHISGSSAIMRTKRTIYHDNINHGIEMSSKDRFTWDGQRLINISGSYGANNTIYGTESETFAKITSYGSTGSGPTWFKVELKDGTELEYGKTSDSRKSNSDGVLIWYLNKKRTKSGNYIEYQYINSGNEVRLSKIRYTGNDITNLSPYNSVEFTYANRFDKYNTYMSGHKLGHNSLLSVISIKVEGAIIRSYQLSYAKSTTQSYLKEIKQKGKYGGQFNSTIFRYGDHNSLLEIENPNFNKTSSANAFLTGDFNGDGQSDIMEYESQLINNVSYVTSLTPHIKTSHTTQSNYTKKPTIVLPPQEYIGFKTSEGSNHSKQLADFNGDGRDDLILIKRDGNEFDHFRIYFANDNGFNTSNPLDVGPPPNLLYIENNFYVVGDFNGDGRMDIMTMLKASNGINVNAAYVYYGGSSVWNNVWISGPKHFDEDEWHDCDQIFVLDHNGDGKDDIMFIKGLQAEIMTFAESNSVKQLYQSGFPTDSHLCFLGDLNGDGKTDLLTRTHPSNNFASWYINLSKGDNSGYEMYPFNFDVNPNMYSTYFGDPLILADLNGDGKGDILHGYNTSGHPKFDLYYYSGNNIFAKSTHTYTNGVNFLSSSNKLYPLIESNGDGRPEIFHSGNIEFVHFQKENEESLLHGIKDGYDHDIQFEYKTMSEGGSFYTKGAVTSHPLNNVQWPLHLVSAIKSENGMGGFNTTSYSYKEAKFHKEGKGFIGFKNVIASNDALGQYSDQLNSINTTYFAVRPWGTVTKLISNNSTISTSLHFAQYQNLGNNRYFLYPTSSVSTNIEGQQNGIAYSNYDNYGNARKITTTYDNDETVEVNRTFGQFGTPVPSKVITESVKTTRTGEASFTKNMTYTYYSDGLLKSKTDFNGLSKQVKAEYFYSPLGNLTEERVLPGGMGMRSTKYQNYDSKGRFYNRMIDPEGYQSNYTWNYQFGQMKSETTPDGLTTSFSFDQHGREVITWRPYGGSIKTYFKWDVNSSNKTIHFTEVTDAGNPDIKVWYDLMDREVKRSIESFPSNGSWVTSTTTYDLRGNVHKTTRPRKSNEPTFTTTNTYDAYNRPSTIVDNIGTTSYSYSYPSDHLKTSMTNPAGQVSSTIVDATGKTVSATDYGGTLNYKYYSHGGLKDVKQGSIILISNSYDAYGRQTTMNDVDAGTTQYIYDALGQLIRQTNARNQMTNFTYDKLGRTKTHQRPEGTSTYNYFSNGNGAKSGQLQSITGYSGTETYNYDNYGRMNSKTVMRGGNSFSFAYTYDNYDNRASITFPSGLRLNYTYDQSYLKTIKNSNNTITHYESKKENGYSQITEYELANGRKSTRSFTYGYPTNFTTLGFQDLDMAWNYQSGNLTSRTDNFYGRSESFTYDNLNRLKQKTGSGSGQSILYNSNGNIKSKSDLSSQNYDYHPTKIHAVSKVPNTSSALNLSNDVDVSFTSFQQPITISKGNKNNQFVYGHDDQRIVMTSLNQNAVDETKYYMGEYDVIDYGTNDAVHVHYVEAQPGLVAVIVKENGITSNNYTYTDHLGTVLMATNGGHSITAKQSFDAWGRQRDAHSWNYTSSSSFIPNWLSNKGYTGHEYLNDFGLVNMNGRLYDPLLGRMLSPDNFVPMSESTQGYNRYSYALNNPLKYTDPDGELPIFAIIGIGAATGVLSNGIANAYYGNNFFDGAVKSAIFGAIAGGASAGIGGLFGGAGNVGHEFLRAGAHALSGGIQSSIQGGSFLEGLASGGISSLVGSGIGAVGGYGGDVIIGGAIGGAIGAGITGGDVALGFTQGLVVSAFNHVAHSTLSNGGCENCPDLEKRLLAERIAKRQGGDAQDYYDAIGNEEFINNRINENINGLVNITTTFLGGSFGTAILRKFVANSAKLHPRLAKDIYGGAMVNAGKRGASFLRKDIAMKGKMFIKDYRTISFRYTTPAGQKFSIGYNPWSRKIVHMSPGF